MNTNNLHTDQYSVSVIIPIFNAEQSIEKCCRSLFEQTLDSIQFIFVDDCTPDNSINILNAILSEYPQRRKNTKIIHHSSNKGVGSARKTGIIHAIGDFIIHCDSDDWVEKNMYEQMYKVAKASDADIVICDFNEIYPQTTKLIHVNPLNNNLQCVEALLSGSMHGGLWNKLVKRTLYTEHKIIPIDGLNFCEDFYLLYKLFFFAKKILFIDTPLYQYNKCNINSITFRKLNKKDENNIIFLNQEIKNFFYEQKIQDDSLLLALQHRIAFSKIFILLYGNPYNTSIQNLRIPRYSIIHHPNLTLLDKIILLQFSFRLKYTAIFLINLYHRVKVFKAKYRK